MITTKKLRDLYISFFKSKGHAEISGARLIPENDPTVLFTTAGMHPLVPFLLGEEHPAGKRLTDVQRCIRTGDIDEVGDASHLTFFEMLGNWSLGDYFKEEAIKFSFEFLTSPDWLNIPVEKLAVTVFEGDSDAPRDDEAFQIWRKLGIPEHKISFMPKKDNWWGPAGQTGPCGPDTEMFFYLGEGIPSVDSNVKSDPKNWVEIWNDVFMQYNKTADGAYIPLKSPNVDTGMGLERTVAVLNGVKNVYEIDVFKPLIDLLKQSARNYDEANARICADHVRAVTFMAMDGVSPSNLDQGYIMRRLIRRVVRALRKMEVSDESLILKLVTKVCELMGEDYPKLKIEEANIVKIIAEEKEQFQKTLTAGIKEFEKINFKLEKESRNILEGSEAFLLYETYGLPLEIIEELSKEKGVTVDLKGFEEASKKHQELSRAGSEQKFKGGLADHSEQTTRLHTATHLLHQALRQVLGTHVEQKGSNITAERLRFDFSHPDKMTEEQLKEVEAIVNEQIEKAHPVSFKEMTVEEAKASGAIGLFEHKYGEKVKVYTVGTDDSFFSREICGGPHVKNTSELVSFKIQKEESSSKGVRRIKADVGQ